MASRPVVNGRKKLMMLQSIFGRTRGLRRATSSAEAFSAALADGDERQVVLKRFPASLADCEERQSAQRGIDNLLCHRTLGNSDGNKMSKQPLDAKTTSPLSFKRGLTTRIREGQIGTAFATWQEDADPSQCPCRSALGNCDDDVMSKQPLEARTTMLSLRSPWKRRQRCEV